MLAKIHCRLVSHGYQGFFQCFPVKYIDTHTCKITSGICRLLLKIDDFAVPVRNHNTETAGLFNGYRHYSDGDLGIVCLVEVKHYLIIHLVNMVS